MIAGSSQNLAAPAAPTITQRVAGSNETAITGGGTHFSVVITALNYFGETAAGTATVDTPLTSGNVVDVHDHRGSRARSSTTSTSRPTPRRERTRTCRSGRPSSRV